MRVCVRERERERKGNRPTDRHRVSVGEGKGEERCNESLNRIVSIGGILVIVLEMGSSFGSGVLCDYLALGLYVVLLLFLALLLFRQLT